MVENVSEFKFPEKVVTRLLKDSLPDNVIITADKAQQNNRITLDNKDIIKAVEDLGLGEYAPQLVRFGAQRKRNAKRKESGINKSKINKKHFCEESELHVTPEPPEQDFEPSPLENENEMDFIGMDNQDDRMVDYNEE